MKKMIALILAILTINLYGCASKDESAVVKESISVEIASESIVMSETHPAATEKKIECVTAYYNGAVSSVATFSYNGHGSLEKVKIDHWNEGAVNYTIDTGYLYDEAGRLIAKKEAGIPYNDIEYVYHDGVCTGYIDNEYWDYGDGNVEMGGSVEYFFERDAAGNIVKLYTDPLSFEVWTKGEYTYDAGGRIIAAYEEEKYGDHEFTKDYDLDYSHKGIIVANWVETLFEYSYTNGAILLSDLSCGPVYLDVQIPEGGEIILDSDGYAAAIVDASGNVVSEFKWN